MISETPTKKPKKWVLFSLPVALVVAGAWFWLSSGRFEETENAAYQQARITIASDVGGRVETVYVTDSTPVEAGAPLFQVDPEPYNLALAQADANLAQARLQIDQLRASYQMALAQEKSAGETANYYTAELARQSAITQRGAGTEAGLSEARHNAESATETLNSAHQAVASALAALGGVPDIATDEHPTVQSAVVARNKAAYDLSLTTVHAPANGTVYRADNFKKGQYISAGSALFSLVETDDAWINANFKETQLGHMAPGNTATVTFDTFPGREFTATVESIGAGTGAEFSVLPAQNATGNWVKVTQRVPVRLRLDDGQDTGNLRTGISATVTVDTGAKTRLGAFFASGDK